MLSLKYIYMNQEIEDQIPDTSRRDATQPDTSRHTLTIKQAAGLFAELGVPRSPRSIQRFCELNNIDCIRVKGEKTERYFINRPSVERYAQELKQLENISRIENDTSRHDAPQRDVSRNDATRREAAVATEPVDDSSDEVTTLRERVGTLEKEKFQLSIDRAAKEQVISQMVDERRGWLGQITQQSREIGRLEMQVQQLAAPKDDTSRHDATVIVEAVAAPSVDPTPIVIATPLPVPDSPPKRSMWGKIFG